MSASRPCQQGHLQERISWQHRTTGKAKQVRVQHCSILAAQSTLTKRNETASTLPAAAAKLQQCETGLGCPVIAKWLSALAFRGQGWHSSEHSAAASCAKARTVWVKWAPARRMKLLGHMVGQAVA